jgi:iron complex outermembrane receptor protein
MSCLRGGLLLGVATAAIAAPALAQEAPVTGEPAAAAREVVIVQARKRDEAIEDVPASVTALSTDMVEQLGLDSVEEYVRQIPGGILVGSGPEYLDDIALRGQGGGRLGFSESTTGVYRDGIFVAGGGFGGRTFSRLDFLDMASMEVYRGPQGALYGRNAVGGAVNVITNKPGDDINAKLSASYSDIQKYEVEGAATAPLTDSFAVRAAGYMSEQVNGFYRRNTGEVLDDASAWGARASARLDVGPSTQVTGTIESSYSDDPAFVTLGQHNVLDAADPFKRVGLSDNGRAVIEQSSVSGELVHDFEGSTLTVLASYKDRTGERTGDDLDHFLGVNNAAVRLLDNQGEDYVRTGAEARLVSSGSGRWQWLVGGDFLDSASDVFSSRTGSVALPVTSPTAVALRRQLRRDVSTEDLNSYSVFGLVGYDLTDRINITAEARVQSDQKDFVFQRIDTDALTNDSIALTTFSEEWTRFLPALSMNYEITDTTTAYARYATGYRPGGYNPTPEAAFLDKTGYDPEDVWSVEGGIKGSYRWGRTVVRPQLAVFYSVTDNVQQTTTLSPTQTAFSLQNVGGNYIYGAELELFVSTPVLGGTFTTNMGLSGNYGEFDDGTDIIFSGAVFDLGGLRVPRTRDYIVNINPAYAHPLGDDLNGFISFNFQAEGGGYDNATNSRGSSHYEIYDLSVGVSGDHWRLIAYAKNMTDEVYRIVEVNNNSYYNTPQTYGARLILNY